MELSETSFHFIGEETKAQQDPVMYPTHAMQSVNSRPETDVWWCSPKTLYITPWCYLSEVSPPQIALPNTKAHPGLKWSRTPANTCRPAWQLLTRSDEPHWWHSEGMGLLIKQGQKMHNLKLYSNGMLFWSIVYYFYYWVACCEN